MILEKNVSLKDLTTLRVGGSAKFFVSCSSEKEVHDALVYAKKENLPYAILGGGSNTLIPDEGFDGLVIHIKVSGMTWSETEDALVTVGAGVSWDALVREAARRNVWGIENLAGIPGSVGGAVVQNIGAYGAELSETCISAEVFDAATESILRVSRDEARFGYRDSIFKHNRTQIVLRATFQLSSRPTPRLSYPDLRKVKEAGAGLTSPEEIGETVRGIRAGKFPVHEGTAGSFFKNPLLSKERAKVLQNQYPDIPTYAD